jgi:hypothetical protein
MSEEIPGIGGRGPGVGEAHGSDARQPTTDNRLGAMDSSFESVESAATAPSPTPDPRLPTPASANWPFLYSAVIIELAILIIIFYAFTKAFA